MADKPTARPSVHLLTTVPMDHPDSRMSPPNHARMKLSGAEAQGGEQEEPFLGDPWTGPHAHSPPLQGLRQNPSWRGNFSGESAFLLTAWCCRIRCWKGSSRVVGPSPHPQSHTPSAVLNCDPPRFICWSPNSQARTQNGTQNGLSLRTDLVSEKDCTSRGVLKR